MGKSKKFFIIGVDEAGRGPLAGPLAVAAVAATAKIPDFKFLISKKIPSPKFQKQKFLRNIKDSKKLSAKQREKWRKIICENFECHAAMVGPEIIDRLGINEATRLAASRVLRKFKIRQHSILMVLLDGGMSAPKHYNQKTIIKGDEKNPLISAASIIAKTARDSKMLRFHKKFPQYCFDQHKGYGTKLHYKILKKHSLSLIHRCSFCK